MERCKVQGRCAPRRSAHPAAQGGDGRSTTTKSRNRRGIALAWTAIVLFVMVGMVGLSIDWGKLVWNAQQLQNAADAGALAGAQVVKDRSADPVLRTHDLAFANWADQLPVTLRTTAQPPTPFTEDDPTLDIFLGRWVRYNHTFIATLDAPNAVRAVARRNPTLGAAAPPLAMVFGPIFGTNTANAEREAVAFCADSGGSGLICLSDTAVPGLILSGTADIDVEGGGIHVNSTAASDVPSGNADGAQVSGTAQIDCGFINVVGEITPEPNSSEWEGIFLGGADDGGAGFTVTDATTNSPPQRVDDPLAAVMMNTSTPYVLPPGDHLDLGALIGDATTPGVIPTYDIPTVTSNATLPPGYYPNGISITNGVTVTLDPQGATSGIGTVFIFGGGGGQPGSLGTGLTINGGTLIGHGVTCYVTKNVATGVCGVTDWGAGAVVDLWSPGDWQSQFLTQADPSLVQGFNGIAVWQDPTMRDAKGETPQVHLNGSPGGGVHGTLYFPDPIHIFLNGDLGQMGNQILCGSATIDGKATISIDYDGRNTPGFSHRAFLVR
ncbi:MAG: pilus assembly protein TadG-related protein [Planctomycetes bacterium]|nr:pilus assembly protein TadG-related protein [Planctomycetota bacterium]